MEWNFLFVINSALLGIGLAMDAFSVSMANGLNEPQMNRKKTLFIASLFAVLQGLMPLIGWFFITTISEQFVLIQKCVPYFALIILSFIGIKMIVEGIKENKQKSEDALQGKISSLQMIIIQGIATSIDALSVGFAIESYTVSFALVSAIIIAVETFFICWLGVVIGKKFGNHLAAKSSIFGGIILIVIGVEILINSLI